MSSRAPHPFMGVMAPLLDVMDVSKSFGPTKALSGARLSLQPGEIHALVGENGAGKSTLMKILSGVHRADSGRILLQGNEIHPSTPREAQRLGISTVFQELSLCPNLSVAENIFVNREPAFLGFIKSKALTAQTDDYLRQFHVSIAADTRVADLNIAQKQIIEIIKAISFEARVLILDEPTSALEMTETNRLFDLLRAMKERGTGIIFISHKLNEVFRVADRITVFRDGEYVATREAAAASQGEIIKLMVGREINQMFPRKQAVRGKEKLRVSDFSSAQKFRDISFTLSEGEILGVAGLTGSGRTEVMQSIFGYRPRETGDLSLEGEPLSIGSPAAAIRNNIIYSPEDRKEQGLFLDHTVAMNISSTCLEQCSSSVFISARKESDLAEKSVAQFRIKARSVQAEVNSLSGGNQQKVLLAKCLAAHPKVLIADEPTRGIDIGSKIEIYDLLRGFTEQGGSVILVSSDLTEIIGLSDRVLVFKEGRIVGELAGTMTEESVMDLMFKYSEN
jgi:ABC-type sugar transport system ATPase subunit